MRPFCEIGNQTIDACVLVEFLFIECITRKFGKMRKLRVLLFAYGCFVQISK